MSVPPSGNSRTRQALKQPALSHCAGKGTPRPPIFSRACEETCYTAVWQPLDRADMRPGMSSLAFGGCDSASMLTGVLRSPSGSSRTDRHENKDALAVVWQCWDTARTQTCVSRLVCGGADKWRAYD